MELSLIRGKPTRFSRTSSDWDVITETFEDYRARKSVEAYQRKANEPTVFTQAEIERMISFLDRDAKRQAEETALKALLKAGIEQAIQKGDL